MAEKLSQREIIRLHLEWCWGLWRDGLRSTPFVPSYSLRGARLTINRQGHDGWAGHQGDRRARELAQDGLAYRREGQKGIVWYALRDPDSAAEQGSLL